MVLMCLLNVKVVSNVRPKCFCDETCRTENHVHQLQKSSEDRECLILFSGGHSLLIKILSIKVTLKLLLLIKIFNTKRMIAK